MADKAEISLLEQPRRIAGNAGRECSKRRMVDGAMVSWDNNILDHTHSIIVSLDSLVVWCFLSKSENKWAVRKTKRNKCSFRAFF